MTDTSLFENFNVVHQYTRAEAIEDGLLIDVSDFAKEAGFNMPVAFTLEAYDRYVDWNDDDNKRQTYQDVKGRLWDIFCMMKWQQKRINHNGLFELACVPRNTASKRRIPVKVVLKAIIHGGDNGEPVITIMMPNED